MILNSIMFASLAKYGLIDRIQRLAEKALRPVRVIWLERLIDEEWRKRCYAD